MSFTVRCQCGQTLEVSDEAAGQAARCPACGRTFTIPTPPGVAQTQPRPSLAPPPAGLVRCWRCGATTDAGVTVCAACGAALMVPVAAPPPPAEGAALGGLIPYKNVPALVGYYLAVFALIPCVGIGLGIAAVILGVIGIGRARRHPEARGKVHAWFAVIFGGFCAVGYIALLVLATATDFFS